LNEAPHKNHRYYDCSLMGGLVTDPGGSVSHGAVIAREYGLPCAVNTRQATKFLKTGNRVRLDGGTNNVTLIT
jgi:pyruvate,water dikinase